MSIPFNFIIPFLFWLSPFFTSKILKSPNNSDDLPLPVLPTIPIFSLSFITTEKSLITNGRFDLY